MYWQIVMWQQSFFKVESQFLQYKKVVSLMTKYYKTYLNNKKESNISQPLRFSFLTSVFIDGLSVKHAALKWKIHYSSAKIIAREAKRSQLYDLIKQGTTNDIPKKPSGWKEVKAVEPQETPMTEKDLEQSSLSANTGSSGEVAWRSRIQIISTIGWSFIESEGVKTEN